MQQGIEIESVTRTEPEDLAALAPRIGEAAFVRRLEQEQRLRERRGHGQGKGVFAVEHRVDLYSVIRFCLKASFLWRRAVRNYFDIRVERNEVVLERLPRAFDGFRVLQLSDLHADLDEAFPQAVIGAVAGLDYDLVLMTGDYRTCTYSDHSGATRATIGICRHLTAPCYAVLGNHDSLAKVPPMEAAGIRFLLNENAVVGRGGASLHLIGIDDPNFYRTHDFGRALDGVPAESCKLLLSHSPQTHVEADRLGIDFVLSGHTHGGQLCLPGGAVLVHDGAAPRKLLAGPWREGRTQGYTSRGTGATGLPVRLNCPAEVTLHTLRCG
ncbi:MAG: metallophosphoesterase [Opitutales bacterium]